MWETRYYIRTSPIGGYGLYAAREYKKGEAITAYTGTIMGPADDAQTLEWLSRVLALGIGRHVMQVGGMLVDGESGASGAQYINSDYNLMGTDTPAPATWTRRLHARDAQQHAAERGWWARGVWVTSTRNNAQFKATGTIRAAVVIHKNDEQ